MLLLDASVKRSIVPSPPRLVLPAHFVPNTLADIQSSRL